MPGTRNPNATLCHSERSEESRPGKGKRFFAYALNDKCPNAEEHPPSPPFKGGKSEAKGGCYPFKKGGMQCGQPSAFSVQSWVFGLGR